MTEYACSVVVPTYNAAEALPSQLAALASQDFTEPIEVVISDNGVNTTSRPRSHAPGRTASPSRWSTPHAGQGVSVARNVGIAAAASDLILLCDADDVVTPGWVGSMVEALRDHPFVGGLFGDTHSVRSLCLVGALSRAHDRVA